MDKDLIFLLTESTGQLTKMMKDLEQAYNDPTIEMEYYELMVRSMFNYRQNWLKANGLKMQELEMKFWRTEIERK